MDNVYLNHLIFANDIGIVSIDTELKKLLKGVGKPQKRTIDDIKNTAGTG